MTSLWCLIFAFLCVEEAPMLHSQEAFKNEKAFKFRAQTMRDLAFFKDQIEERFMDKLVHELSMFYDKRIDCDKYPRSINWNYLFMKCSERETARHALSHTLRVVEERWGGGPFDESWDLCDLPEEEVKPVDRTAKFDVVAACKGNPNGMWYSPEINPDKKFDRNALGRLMARL